MKITDVRTHLITARWSDDPYFPVQLHTTALIEILTDQGLNGVGESILGYFVPDAVAPIVEFYKPLLIGRDAGDITGIWERLYLASMYWGRTGAALAVLSGIDIALWDLKAKAAGVPLYQLLGGAAKSRQPVYCSGGPALWPIKENVDKCRYYIEQGYRALKFATGYYIFEEGSEMPSGWRMRPVSHYRLAQEEAEKCAAAREAVGPEVDLILDGHQGALADPYSLADAQRVSEAVAPYGMLFFEEPLPYTDPRGYAALRAGGRLPIAGGESLSGIHDFRSYLEMEALDVVQPEVTYAGGITTCSEILRLAQSRNLRAAMHCGGTAGPGLAASIHLSFASPIAIQLEHLLHSTSIQRDLMVEPVVLRDGSIAPPTAPGLGIEISNSLLAKYPYIPGTGEVC
ncbi:MAG: mandelate racemase/muconate lactonizing enzyme family protein [Acidobacteria bacterium]|nr:mandelate racemase/muconate lactonizing enzyme family protein [Acidobacteriota bacterium]